MEHFRLDIGNRRNGKYKALVESIIIEDCVFASDDVHDEHNISGGKVKSVWTAASR
jgi:hypothetical protein